MNVVKCQIVDDEPYAIEVLKNYIDRIPALQLVSTCSNAIEAFSLLQHTSIDLIFLDIKMPQLSGTELVRTLEHRPHIIFTTAYREYAFDGFELNALDFLLKPVSFDRFLKSISKLLKAENTNEPVKEIVQAVQDQFLYLRVDRKMIKIMVADIIYVESLKDYVKIILNNKQIVTKHTITALEAMLPEEQFLRVHRSFIVNSEKVEAISQSHLQIGIKEIPVGPTYKHHLQQKIKWTES